MRRHISLTLFGYYRITYGRKELTEKNIRSRKLLQLLTYLLLHNDRKVSMQELMDVFAKEEDDPAGTVKTLLYRLHGVLMPFGDEEFLCTDEDSCQWNPVIPVEVDCLRFLALGQEITKSRDDIEALCHEGIDLFQEGFSKKLITEPWFAEMEKHCEELRLQMFYALCRVYEAREEWIELENTCRTALNYVTDQEEYYFWMIQSLYMQEHYSAAIAQYETAKHILITEEGGKMPPKLLNIYQDMLSEIGRNVRGIDNVLEEASEEEKEEGAFEFEYDTFREYFQIETRRMSRRSQLDTQHLILFTLQAENMETEEIQLLMKLLGISVRRSLRGGDVFSRCGERQYIILLEDCNYENSEKVAGRIQNSFNVITSEKSSICLRYEIDSLKKYETQKLHSAK